MAVSKVSVDLQNRTFEIEVDGTELGKVIEILSDLFEKHSSPVSPARTPPPETERPASDPLQESGEGKPKRRKNGTKGPSKVRTYKTVELGLDAASREDIKAFFADKSPKGQSNEVAVLVVKLQEKMGKSNFSLDEVHSAFRIVNRPTPKNLVAVFGNMKRDGIAGYENYEVHVNSFTEDHVNHHMNS